jgi:hypothetical protein
MCQDRNFYFKSCVKIFKLQKICCFVMLCFVTYKCNPYLLAWKLDWELWSKATYFLQLKDFDTRFKVKITILAHLMYILFSYQTGYIMWQPTSEPNKITFCNYTSMFNYIMLQILCFDDFWEQKPMPPPTSTATGYLYQSWWPSPNGPSTYNYNR